MDSGDRQRSGGRDEQQRSDEGTGERRGSGADWVEGRVHCQNPSFDLFGPDCRDRTPMIAGTVPILVCRLFSVRVMPDAARLVVKFAVGWEISQVTRIDA
jgi:hypothetical protein